MITVEPQFGDVVDMHSIVSYSPSESYKVFNSDSQLRYGLWPSTSSVSPRIQTTVSTFPSTAGPALRRLQMFSSLGRNWDSYDAEPPSAVALGAARQLMLKLESSSWAFSTSAAAPSSVAPISDGGVQLTWRNRGELLEIEVSPDGLISCLIDHGLGLDRFEERNYLSLDRAFDEVQRFVT